MQCPVCQTELRDDHSRGERYFYECLRCGSYSFSRRVKDDLPWHLGRDEKAAQKLSYALYRMTKREQWAFVDSDLLENILSNTIMPRPQEQLENLLLWVGEKQPEIGTKIEIDDSAIPASGAADMHAVAFLLADSIENGWIEGKVEPQPRGEYLILPIRLTMSGWKAYEELLRGKSSGKNTFMAMQFGDSELDQIFSEVFKPAVKEAGFELKRLDEGQPAGLIDDRLRVEIRQSRFLIADLTHQNRGAYWEAGYAEGLGKPVIYTCRKDVFEDVSKGTHFDTNHHLTVVWEPDKLGEASEKLKATIRATLPEEAKLSD